MKFSFIVMAVLSCRILSAEPVYTIQSLDLSDKEFRGQLMAKKEMRPFAELSYQGNLKLALESEIEYEFLSAEKLKTKDPEKA